MTSRVLRPREEKQRKNEEKQRKELMNMFSKKADNSSKKSFTQNIAQNKEIDAADEENPFGALLFWSNASDDDGGGNEQHKADEEEGTKQISSEKARIVTSNPANPVKILIRLNDEEEEDCVDSKEGILESAGRSDGPSTTNQGSCTAPQSSTPLANANNAASENNLANKGHLMTEAGDSTTSTAAIATVGERVEELSSAESVAPLNSNRRQTRAAARKRAEETRALFRERRLRGSAEGLEKARERQAELRRLFQSGEVTSKVAVLSTNEPDERQIGTEEEYRANEVENNNTEEEETSSAEVPPEATFEQEAKRFLKADGPPPKDFLENLDWDTDPKENVSASSSADMSLDLRLSERNGGSAKFPDISRESSLDLRLSSGVASPATVGDSSSLNLQLSYCEASPSISAGVSSSEPVAESKVEFKSPRLPARSEAAAAQLSPPTSFCADLPSPHSIREALFVASPNVVVKRRKRKPASPVAPPPFPTFSSRTASQMAGFPSANIDNNSDCSASTSKFAMISENYGGIKKIRIHKRVEFEAEAAARNKVHLKSCLKRKGNFAYSGVVGFATTTENPSYAASPADPAAEDDHPPLSSNRRRVNYALERTSTTSFEIDEGNTMRPYLEDKECECVKLTKKYTKMPRKRQTFKKSDTRAMRMTVRTELEALLGSARARREAGVVSNGPLFYSRWLIADGVLHELDDKIFKNMLVSRLEYPMIPNWLVSAGLKEVDFDFEVSYIFVACGIDWRESGAKSSRAPAPPNFHMASNFLRELHAWVHSALARKEIARQKNVYVMAEGREEKVEMRYAHNLPVIVAVTVPEVGENVELRSSYNVELRNFVNEFNALERNNARENGVVRESSSSLPIELLDWAELFKEKCGGGENLPPLAPPNNHANKTIKSEVKEEPSGEDEELRAEATEGLDEPCATNAAPPAAAMSKGTAVAKRRAEAERRVGALVDEFCASYGVILR